MTDPTDPTGKTFEARIQGLLKLLGYRVQHDRMWPAARPTCWP
jgi:hypothetical protein